MKIKNNSEHLAQFSVELQTAVAAVRKAADKIRQTAIIDTEQEKTGGVNDFVTVWDTVGQQVITDELKAKFPADEILGEESEQHVENPTQQKRLWVIDPIDGTANVKAGRKYSFISLGFVQEGESMAGVVYDPYHDDVYYGEKGNGAFKNGEPIRVSKNTIPEKAAINTDMGFINQVSDLHQNMLQAYGSK